MPMFRKIPVEVEAIQFTGENALEMTDFGDGAILHMRASDQLRVDTSLNIGRQGVAFDRLEMDAWVDHYMRCNGRPALNRGDEVWDAIETPGYGIGAGSGISTSRSSATAFTKALERVNSKRRN